MTQIVIHRRAADAAEALAVFVAECLTETPALVLGLPTGRTPVPFYRALVAEHRRGRADFSRATTFNLDEFLGLPRGARGTYRRFMSRHLFDHVNLDPARTHLPDSAADDPEREARRYDAAIAAAGGLDLVVLGIGANGHIGFNEPARHLSARTTVATLRAESRLANAAAFGGAWRRVPRQAISMGMGTILSARHVVLLATGAAKAGIVGKALTGPITTRVPASLLQVHPKAVVVLDRAAAARLP
jgi:glucosamine-6-phosphate deaminase